MMEETEAILQEPDNQMKEGSSAKINTGDEHQIEKTSQKKIEKHDEKIEAVVSVKQDEKLATQAVFLGVSTLLINMIFGNYSVPLCFTRFL